jgi:taurine dioxygenase
MVKVKVKVTPTSTGFVADVDNVDVKTVADEEFKVIYNAWLQHGVLRLRGQQIDEHDLQVFSARFGPLEEIPMGRMAESDRVKIKNRYVTQLSNIRVNGKPIGGLGNSEASWHSDMTYVETPPPASILLGVEIPAQGGDTHFANQYAAYVALPERLRTRLKSVTIKHDASHTSIGKLRAGFGSFRDSRDAPGAIHPAILRHSETGKYALYLGRREWAYIPGLSLEKSESLLDEIWSFATLPENIWQQQWQPDDLIIWDNRSVLHRRDGFDPDSRRLMKRCQVLSRIDGPVASHQNATESGQYAS